MKQINAFQTSDGTVFTDKQCAIVHEENMNLNNKINDLIAKNPDFDDLPHENKDEIIEFITVFKAEIYLMLGKYYDKTKY